MQDNMTGFFKSSLSFTSLSHHIFTHSYYVIQYLKPMCPYSSDSLMFILLKINKWHPLIPGFSPLLFARKQHRLDVITEVVPVVIAGTFLSPLWPSQTWYWPGYYWACVCMTVHYLLNSIPVGICAHFSQSKHDYSFIICLKLCKKK